MTKLLIPQDWNGIDKEVWLICAPASPGWRQALRTAVGSLHRGRTWDRSSGEIVKAQQIGWEIYDDMTTCNDMVTALQSIATALAGMSQTINVSGVCCEQILPPDPVIPPDPGDYPVPGGGNTPPGFVDPPAYDAAVCAAVNGLLWSFRRYADAVLKGSQLWTAAAAVVALLAALFPEPVTTAVGTVSFVALASVLAASLIYADALEDGADQFIAWLDANRQDLVCDAYAAQSGLMAAVSDIIGVMQYNLNSLLVAAGVPAALASPVSALIGDVAGFVDALATRLAFAPIEWQSPPVGWAVDCTCADPNIAVLNIEPDSGVWVTAGAVTQVNGTAVLARNGSSSGAEASMQLLLSDILSMSGFSEAYAVSVTVEGLAASPTGSYRTVELRAQFRNWNDAPPSATQAWRMVEQQTVCISPTVGTCVAPGNEEPFLIDDAAAFASPYPLADGGFRITTYRPTASGGDAAVWGTFTIERVQVTVSAVPVV